MKKSIVTMLILIASFNLHASEPKENGCELSGTMYPVGEKISLSSIKRQDKNYSEFNVMIVCAEVFNNIALIPNTKTWDSISSFEWVNFLPLVRN